MKLNYVSLEFNIHFANPIVPDVNPLFIIRSMLGKNLHELSCAAKGTKCYECLFNKSCVYSYVFESIISQENDIHKGINRSSHPFVIKDGYYEKGKELSDYSFTVILLGKAIEYASYINKAILMAGESGVFKSRTGFSITSLIVNNENMLSNMEESDFRSFALSWDYDKEESSIPKELLIELKTPLRFKKDGAYDSSFEIQDLFKCLYRRMNTLCTLYGSIDDTQIPPLNERIKIKEKNLKWEDDTHYSSRQHSAVKMGGFVGTLKIVGDITKNEMKLLQFARIFSAGKNTNFGLGQLDFWTR